MKDRSQACEHLRNVLRHRLRAWDESLLAEKLLGEEVDTACVDVDEALAGLESEADVASLSDERILSIFQVGEPSP